MMIGKTKTVSQSVMDHLPMHMVVAPLTNISCYEKFEKETFKIHQFAQPNNIEFINQVGIVIKRCMLQLGIYLYIPI